MSWLVFWFVPAVFFGASFAQSKRFSTAYWWHGALFVTCTAAFVAVLEQRLK